MIRFLHYPTATSLEWTGTGIIARIRNYHDHFESWDDKEPA